MSDTTFVNGVTLTDAGWFNDLNRLFYTIFANPATTAAARRTLLAGLESITNTLSGDVSLNNTSSYFDGPSCAQGTSGIWLAIGTVTLIDTAGVAGFLCKLWDGTTVMASGFTQNVSASAITTITLAGVITTPTDNIRISVKDGSSTSGAIKFNASGNSKDSSLSVFRIG